MNLINFSAEIWSQIGQGLALILLAPFLLGLLRWFKAELVGRHRPPATTLHPYYDLIELTKRPAVRPESVSFLFGATPPLLLQTYGVLAFTIPVFQRETLLRVDLLAILYILGLARLIFSLAGLDIGSPFSQIGSWREMFYQFNAEIGFAVFIAGLAVKEKTIEIASLLADQKTFESLSHWPMLFLLALTLLIALILEAGRIPVDNQESPYELTVGHRSTSMEYSGRDLALIELAETIKLIFLSLLFLDLFLPFAAMSFFVKLVLLIFGLALFETVQPKARIRTVPNLTLWSVVFGFFAIVYTIGSKP